MRSLRGAPMSLVGEMRFGLGQVRPFHLGQTSTQDLEDAFIEQWGTAPTIQERARVEQQFLARFTNRATAWETELRTELGRQPRQAGRIVELIDGSDRAARFLENAREVLPTAGQAFPASATVGLPWTGPADALVARFRAVRDGGCGELERMRAEFERYPATPTPRVCPTTQIPPTARERQAPSGEPGGRPRTFLDDALDWVKDKALGLLLVGAWGYVVYEVSKEEPEPERRRVQRRRVPVRA